MAFAMSLRHYPHGDRTARIDGMVKKAILPYTDAQSLWHCEIGVNWILLPSRKYVINLYP